MSRKELRIEKISAIVVDIDGTFLDSREEVPQENVRAVLEALENGVRVIFASGRMLASITGLLKKHFRREFPVIAYNGGLVASNGRIHLKKALDRNIAVEIAADVLKQNVYIQAYVNDELVVPKNCEQARAYSIHSGVGFKVKRDFVGFLEANDTMKLLVIDEPDVLERLKSSLERQFPDADIFKSFATYLDIVPKGINKGAALERMAEILELKLFETVAFGDNDNDVPLFEAVGYAVAMGNATPAAKAAADIVAPIADKAGFAKSLRHLLAIVD